MAVSGHDALNRTAGQRVAVLIVGILFTFGFSSFAHGDLHDRIEAVTQKIKEAPQNVTLYWERGELYRLHYEWKLALEDYDHFESLETNFAFVDLGRGKALVLGEQFSQAKAALDRFLSKFPEHGDALVARARVLAKLGDHLAAARDYTKAIPLYREPQPEFFIERAQALVAASNKHVTEAIRGLDEGMQKIGFGITLQIAAIDMEVQAKEYERALVRLDKLMANMPRKEAWLLRRAEILGMAGRLPEAKKTILDALAALDALPPAHRYVRTMDELQQKLKTTLVHLQECPNNTENTKTQTKYEDNR